VSQTINLTYLPTVNLNLTVHTSGDTSPLEDYIFFWFKIDPFRGTSRRLEIFFYSGGDNKNHARYLMRTENKQVPANLKGIAALLEVKNAQGELLERTDLISEADRNKTLESISEKTWILQTEEVQFASIPKKLFAATENFAWNNIHRISFIFQSLNEREEVCIGDVLLVGGGKNESGLGASTTSRGGMQGTYRYRVTFRNTTTGNRSNPGTVTQIARDVTRGYVQLTGIPTSADTQVNAREIWRTVGDGVRFFKIAQINDNVTTSYDDQIADYAGLDSRPGISVMTSEELPLDNDVPDSSFDHHIIHKLTAFWISSTATKAGRVYYSPVGRPEAQKGYIDVSSAGDPLQRLVIFQGIRYVFSESKVYRIQGDDPYFSFEISGVPGVTFAARRTVVATPHGICWQAHDGIRIFNGSTSTLLNFEPLGKIFRGESAENLSAFEGTVAAYARGEYYISTGTQCLAVDIESGAWRHVGFTDLTSLYYEWDDDVLQGGRTSAVHLLEVEGVTADAGSAIAIAWETGALQMPNDGIPFVERAIIDINTGGATITPSLVSRYDTEAYSTISTSTRQAVEVEVQELVLEPAIRLTGSSSARVTLYDVQLDYRQLNMGINVEGESRTTVPGRWREDQGSAGRIVFEVDPEIKQFDQTDQLYVIDRITVEADTEGVTVTPRVVLNNSTVVLSALSTGSTRIVNTYDINRIGPINEFSLDGPFFTTGQRPKIYRVEVHVRELKLGLNVSTTNQRGEAMGRAPVPGTALLFEVQPLQQTFNELGNLYFIERLVLETNTGGTSVTPTIKIGGGTLTLSSFSTSAREYTEISVERIGPIEYVQLAADFTTNIQLFGVELYIRPVSLGIRMPDGKRDEIGGKAVDNGTAVIFDIDPSDRRFDAQSFVPLVERLWLDVDSNSIEITPSIVMENQTVTLTPESTASRDTIMYSVNHIGRIRYVQLAADYVTNAIKLYGVEMQMRQLPLGISIITND
jgi:hypothetical protein